MSVGPDEIVTRAGYARHRGCARSYVTKLANDGRLVLTPDGKVNVRASDDLIAKTRDPARARVQERFTEQRLERQVMELAAGGEQLAPPASSNGIVLLDARGNEIPPREQGATPSQGRGPGDGASAVPKSDAIGNARLDVLTESAKLSRLKRLEAEGRLVDAEQVRRAAFEKARIARNALESLADRMAPQLAIETNATRVYDLLITEIRNVCNELATGESTPTRQ